MKQRDTGEKNIYREIKKISAQAIDLKRLFLCFGGLAHRHMLNKISDLRAVF